MSEDEPDPVNSHIPILGMVVTRSVERMTPPGVTPDYWVWCDCDFGNRYPKPQADHTGLPEYLRELANRVEAGEIVHAGVALHLQPKERYGMHQTQARLPETGQTVGPVPRVDAPIKDTAGLQVS